MAVISKIPSLDEIRVEFLELDSSQDRLGYLIELGDLLPEFPTQFCTEENRVLGCQSMVWLVAEEESGKLWFRATSDAPMVRGLIAILLSAYSGKSPKEILEFDIEGFLSQLHLKAFLTPMRSNGLYSMHQRIRQIAEYRLGGTANSPTDSEDTKSHRNAELPTRKIVDCRQDFPILAVENSSGVSVAFLDNAASSQRPVDVIEAMDAVYRTHYANAHRSGHDWATETTAALEGARESLQRFIGAGEKEEVVLTSGTTMSINLVARAWGDQNISAGDEIVLSELEHHSNIVPWQQLAARRGAKIRWIRVRDDFRLDMDSLTSVLSTKTRMVAISAVSNVLGTINPIAEIADLVHRTGSLILVDAAQAVPHGPIDVRSWNADFVAFSGHKMLGPTGIGVLYGRLDHLQSMPAFLGGGGMIDRVDLDGFTLAGVPNRFEAGTPPIVEAIAMKTAVEYLESFEPGSLLEHERQLLAVAEEHLLQVPGLRILGPSLENRSGILTFVVDGIHHDSIDRMLNAQGIAIRKGHHCAMPLHTRFGITGSCRASFYLYNTLDEAERLGRAVVEIAKRLR